MNTFADKYEIIRPIGQGGMCDVLLAKQLLFDRIVAIKVLKRNLAQSADCRKRFLREAQNCARLSHESIVTIYEIGEHEAKPFISMQYLDGGSYDSWLATGGKLLTGLSILSSVASALSCAHEANILHRDLKPDNVLLSKDLKVKVADWGLAKMMDHAQEITHAGIILGTPEYMSPEQIMSKPLSKASDLYSFGIMLYETISGHLPYPTATLTDILQAHLYKKPYPIRSFAPFISEDLENLVDFLLQKDPDQRIPSAELLSIELDRILQNEAKQYEEITVARVDENDSSANVAHQTETPTSLVQNAIQKATSERITRKTLKFSDIKQKTRTTVIMIYRKNYILIIILAIVATILLVFGSSVSKLWLK